MNADRRGAAGCDLPPLSTMKKHPGDEPGAKQETVTSRLGNDGADASSRTASQSSARAREAQCRSVAIEDQQLTARQPNAPGVVENGQRLVEFWSRDTRRRGRLVRVHLSSWQGRPYLQLRAWYADANLLLRPSRACIVVRGGAAGEFARAWALARGRVERGDVRRFVRTVQCAGMTFTLSSGAGAMTLRCGDQAFGVPYMAVAQVADAAEHLVAVLAGEQRCHVATRAVGGSSSVADAPTAQGATDRTRARTYTSTRTSTSTTEPAPNGAGGGQATAEAGEFCLDGGDEPKRPRRESDAQRFVKLLYARMREELLEVPVRINWARDVKLAKGLIEGFRRALLDPQDAIPSFVEACVKDPWFRSRTRPDFSLAARIAETVSRRMGEVEAPGVDPILAAARRNMIVLARDLAAHPKAEESLRLAVSLRQDYALPPPVNDVWQAALLEHRRRPMSRSLRFLPLDIRQSIIRQNCYPVLDAAWKRACRIAGVPVLPTFESMNPRVPRGEFKTMLDDLAAIDANYDEHVRADEEQRRKEAEANLAALTAAARRARREGPLPEGVDAGEYVPFPDEEEGWESEEWDSMTRVKDNGKLPTY